VSNIPDNMDTVNIVQTVTLSPTEHDDFLNCTCNFWDQLISNAMLNRIEQIENTEKRPPMNEKTVEFIEKVNQMLQETAEELSLLDNTVKEKRRFCQCLVSSAKIHLDKLEFSDFLEDSGITESTYKDAI